MQRTRFSQWGSWTIVLAGCWWLGVQQPGANAQVQVTHPLYRSDSPPGTIAMQQSRVRPDVQGYYQPVRVFAPEGGSVAVASDGVIPAEEPGDVIAGLLIGPVYRLSVQYRDGDQLRRVYPTIELLDRLHPPAAQASRFPIPVEITPDDVRQAMAGHLVTKVVYLEDPQLALPQVQPVGEQRWFDVRGSEDPLQVADTVGKPIVIVRLGSRTPGPAGPDDAFLMGSPPVMHLSGPNSDVPPLPDRRAVLAPRGH